jgi:acetolactate synthase I/II/III large subunit
VLGLFEGVVTGAADGYARMRDRPACTLLHLGPGLANGLSNLHNARRAQSPVVNIVGDHATYHRRLDAPLTSDIEGAARPFSDWVRTSPSADALALDSAAAVAAARSPPGRIATLILPADAAWSEVRSAHGARDLPLAPTSPVRASDAAVDAAASMLKSGEPAAIILGGRATREAALASVGKIAAVTGAKLLAHTFAPRVSRGAGRVDVERIPYPADQAIATLRPYSNLILVGAKPPVSFFAYPNKPSTLYRAGARIHELVAVDGDIPYALEALLDAVEARAAQAKVEPLVVSARPTGAIEADKLGTLIGCALPANAIVVDESITTGRNFLTASRTAQPHEWILPTGGSIGYGLPVAVGAAIASPEQKVVALESDGSGLYTLQALWTLARESLNVLVVLFANRRYQILRAEMRHVGAHEVGPKAAALLDIGDPDVDWVALAQGFGVEAHRVRDMDELSRQVDRGLAAQGPYLIEVVL